MKSKLFVKVVGGLSKLQNLPERKRKLIVWVVTIIVGIGVLSWWIPNLQEKLRDMKGQDIQEVFSFPEVPGNKQSGDTP